MVEEGAWTPANLCCPHQAALTTAATVGRLRYGKLSTGGLPTAHLKDTFK